MGILSELAGDIVSAIPGAGLVEAAVQGRSVQPSDFLPGGRLTPGSKAIDQVVRGEAVTLGSFVPGFGSTADKAGNALLKLPTTFATGLSQTIDKTSDNVARGANQLTYDMMEGVGDIAGSTLYGAGNIAGAGVSGAFQPLIGQGYSPQMLGQAPPPTLPQAKTDNTMLYMAVIGGVTILASAMILSGKDKK